MRITCPSCNAQFSLDAAIQMDAARAALMRALSMPAPLANRIAQYLGMFRAKHRALAMDRAERLMSELLPMLEAGSVTRNGVARPAPIELWAQALDQVIDARNAEKLRLPLKSHGYLLEIVFGLADAADAAQERATEQARKRGEHRTNHVGDPDKLVQLARIRGDLDLGLIQRDEAIHRLAELGYREDAL